jgi:hypothetical protein
MTNGRKPLSDNVIGRPRTPVPKIDAIVTKSIYVKERLERPIEILFTKL